MAYPATLPADVSPGDDILASWGDDVRAALSFLANPPACRVTRTTDLSITDATTTVVDWNAETFDTNTMHDTVTNNSRITFTTAGLYLVSLNVQFATGNDYAYMQARILLGGATDIGHGSGQCNAASVGPFVEATALYKFAAAQYVTAEIFQDNTAGAARNMLSATSNFAAVWVGNG